MRYGNDGHMDDGWGVVMVVGMAGIWILLIAAIVLAIVWAGRAANGQRASAAAPGTPGTASGPTGGAEQILAERLARGDIDPGDYRERVAALASRSGA